MLENIIQSLFREHNGGFKTHDATEHGSKYLQTIIGKRFSYPKALYAVHDAINFAIANKRNALILDFSQVAARLCTP